MSNKFGLCSTENSQNGILKIWQEFSVVFTSCWALKLILINLKRFGVGVTQQEISRWVEPLGCEPSSLPFNYLGVPIGANMKLLKN